MIILSQDLAVFILGLYTLCIFGDKSRSVAVGDCSHGRGQEMGVYVMKGSSLKIPLKGKPPSTGPNLLKILKISHQTSLAFGKHVDISCDCGI